MSNFSDYQLMSALGQVFIPSIMRANSNFKERNDNDFFCQVSMSVTEEDNNKCLVVKCEGKTDLNERKQDDSFSAIDELGRFIIRKKFRNLLDIPSNETESLVIQLVDENTLKIRKLCNGIKFK